MCAQKTMMFRGEYYMTPQPVELKKQVTQSEWYRSLTRYEKSDTRKTTWQLVNTIVPYLGTWAVMVAMLKHHLPYYSIIPVMLISAGLLVRVFIVFHDCGHGSFYNSK